MLFLILSLGDQPCLLPTRDVVEVVPAVGLRSVIGAPDYLAGLLDYRGSVVPVVDLGLLAVGRRCQPRLSTRIILVRHAQAGGERLLGLMAERVTEAVKEAEAGMTTSAVSLEVALDLGEIAASDRGTMQCLSLRRLLPESAERVLGTLAEGGDDAARPD